MFLVLFILGFAYDFGVNHLSFWASVFYGLLLAIIVYVAFTLVFLFLSLFGLGTYGVVKLIRRK